MTLERVNIIAAVANNGGIGLNNELPWRIQKDMTMFKKITLTAKEGRKNAVLQGRRTWDSIPVKFRPLSNRINIVVSNTLSSVPDGVFIVPTFDEALSLAAKLHDEGILDEAFVIGGSAMYKATMEQTRFPVRFYCTHVMQDIKCDTFFPIIDLEKWQKIIIPFIDTEVQKSGDINFRFAVYENCANCVGQ